MDTCRSKLKSDDSVTPSRRTWSRATMKSEPTRETRRQQSCWERLSGSNHSNSVLSALSLRRLADIQRPTSVMHCSSRAAAGARDVRILRFCARRVLRRIGHSAQNLGSCAELRLIYQMAKKMRKFCWFLLTLSFTMVKFTQYVTRC